MHSLTKAEDNGATASNSCEKAAARRCPIDQCNFQENQEFTDMNMERHYFSYEHAVCLQSSIQQKLQDENDQEDQSVRSDSDPLSVQSELLLQSVEQLIEKLSQIQISMYEMKTNIPKVEEETDDFIRSNKIQNATMMGMNVNQTVLECSLRTLKRQSERIQSVGTCSMSDGTVTWTLSHVQEKVLDAQSERATSVYSPHFFTSSTGYKVCIRLYLNGDGTARGSHISIFLVILRGPNDRLLKWPFSYRVAFCLVDQRALLQPDQGEARDIVDCFRPNIQSCSFEKPVTEMNIASGIPKFMPLTIFEEPMDRNRYRINDTIFLRTYIDFRDLNKSLIPFIFSLNPGLPTHVREQIIMEEAKKREEKVLQN